MILRLCVLAVVGLLADDTIIHIQNLHQGGDRVAPFYVYSPDPPERRSVSTILCSTAEQRQSTSTCSCRPMD